jgi:hypothetical protein
MILQNSGWEEEAIMLFECSMSTSETFDISEMKIRFPRLPFHGQSVMHGFVPARASAYRMDATSTAVARHAYSFSSILVDYHETALPATCMIEICANA